MKALRKGPSRVAGGSLSAKDDEGGAHIERRNQDWIVATHFAALRLASIRASSFSASAFRFIERKADGIARTGPGDIARRIGADPRTVRRALRQLEGRGLVDIVRRGRLGGGPSAYRV
ncbi:MAG: hypothetical protein DCC65_07685 [Planctomycetota bacterium]|nr:MAG: hypothetical protein DCC65_07685 [Planctomycetota bacterium]